MLFTTAALSALALPLAVLAAPLESRSDDARFTFYNTETGLGACGNWNPGWKSASLPRPPSLRRLTDFSKTSLVRSDTVALNTKDFNSLGGGYPAASCGKWIWIAHPDSGEKIWAEVQDEWFVLSCSPLSQAWT